MKKFFRNIKKIIIKEIFVYLLLFIVLSITLHFDLLSSPLVRFEKMVQIANYAHPIRYTFLAYLLVSAIRVVVFVVKKLTHKS